MNENNLLPITRETIGTVLLEQAKQLEEKDFGVEREALEIIKKQLKTPFAVVISGLRRSGKSTLLAQAARKFYHQQYYFVNFEEERLLNFKAQDFSVLHQTLIELFGEKKIFMFDEIQNVPDWERFVRRLTDNGYKCYLTGSNASLLSKELGTKLTGRYLPIKLFPFSFKEYLAFYKIQIPNKKVMTTQGRGTLKKFFNDYLIIGGIPDNLKYPEINWPQILYNDALSRDIASRYQIEEPKILKELSYYLLSNISSLVSFNKMKNLLKLGSVNTVKSYVDYLEIAWILFTVNRYAFSVKKQQIANKKIYAIDTGLVKSVAFSFSEDRGKFLENAVFLSLKKTVNEIYYYRTENNQEVDFYLPRRKTLIQVCQSLENTETKQRETAALTKAAAEIGHGECLILTDNETGFLTVNNTKIEVKPVYEWLLE